jgi:hypothetical protein
MKKLVAMVMLAAPVAAFAGSSSYIDGYYIPSANVDFSSPLSSGDDDGDGFGVKGEFNFANYWLFNGQWQTTSYDDSDADIDDLRVGFGATTQGPFRFAGIAEYIRAELDDDDADGFGIHGRGTADLGDMFQAFAQVGYVKLSDDSDEDLDGIEWTVGGAFKFHPMWAIFADYRQTNLEDDSDGELELSQFRVGARAMFAGR